METKEPKELKKQDPNSKRYAKRKARNFQPIASRSTRRAIFRLNVAESGYKDGEGMTKPGAHKRW